MSTDNPTPTPLASTAMEAAREINHEADFGGKLTPVNAVAEIAAIIQKHFQPLLAKVEGERDAANQTVWNREQDILGLRREHAEAFSIRDAALNKCSAAVDLLCESLGWQDRESALRADLAAKEAEVENLKTGELILKEMVLSMNADLAAKEAALRKAVQDQFSPVVVKTIECLARELRKNIGVIDSPAMCVKCGFKIHAPTTGKVLSQCPECYNEMKTVTAALASRADKGGATAAGTPDELKAAVDALAQACGFPKSDNYVQMLEAIGKRERRLTEANNTLRKEVAAFEKLFGLDTPWPAVALYKALVIAESKFREQGRDFDGWEAIQSAAAVAQQRVSDFLKE